MNLISNLSGLTSDLANSPDFNPRKLKLRPGYWSFKGK